jgi:hypothetical protein
MARVIATIEDRHGSVAAYLEGGGVRPEQVRRLQARLR